MNSSRTVAEIQKQLEQLSDRETATFSRKFFKTQPGGYGAGDLFRGIRVPVLRRLVTEYRSVTVEDTKVLLQSPYHEDRLLALLFLVRLYARGDESIKKTVYKWYLQSTQRINNWDLVDSSAEYIVGAYLWDKPRDVLYELAGSENLWERRIAMMSTFHFIKRHDFADTLRLAEILLHDHEDLIHKAVGWMLREVGKRDREAEEKFLAENYRQMPRTMLRYAIEKFPEAQRQRYLKGEV
jgi:3-methyladenine DNA glycosylase AlkD